MIYKVIGGFRKTIIKDSPKSFEYLSARFYNYRGLLITEDNKGLKQGSCICNSDGTISRFKQLQF